MAFVNLQGDDEKRLKVLAEDEDRSDAGMVKRLIAEAYRIYLKRIGGK